MKINNVNSKTSGKTVVTLLIICTVMTAAMIFVYFAYSGENYSFLGFFKWYNLFLNEMLNEIPQGHKTVAYVFFILFPLGFYSGLICSFVSRQLAIKKENSSLFLQSVELNQNYVNFNFNDRSCNVSCGYCDINKLEMILRTQLVHSKNGAYIAIKEIELAFTIINNRTFSIFNTPLAQMNFIYNVLEHAKKIEKFSYRFEGAGAQEAVREKIENFKNKGIKQILSSSQEDTYKFLSVLFFMLGIIVLITCKEHAQYAIQNGLSFVFMPTLAFAGISFVLDLIMLINKIYERKF